VVLGGKRDGIRQRGERNPNGENGERERIRQRELGNCAGQLCGVGGKIRQCSVDGNCAMIPLKRGPQDNATWVC
jgi:hypothetical protein